jgi:hypothetical protein
MSARQKRAFSLSFDAMDRMGEEFLETHPSWAAMAAGPPCLKAGRSQTDEQLLAKLRALGIDTDRESLAQRVRQHPSAEALPRALVQEAGTRLPDTQEANWAWIGIAVLFVQVQQLGNEAGELVNPVACPPDDFRRLSICTDRFVLEDPEPT